MRRFIYSDTLKNLDIIEYDVLIIGSGIAGLYASLHLDPSKKCAIVTKVDLEGSNSWLAQGGIAAVIAPDDKLESHIEDTIKAGAGLCDIEAVRTLVAEGPDNIRELVELNVPFDVNPEGELQITREGGHSQRRIVHCGGDATGRETTRRLGQIALARKNLSVLFNTYLIDVLTHNNCVVGAIIFDKKPKIILCPNIIMCTGGIGHLYNYTTNPRGAVGDGIAAAMRAGANVINMEMVQFHPTTLIPHSNSDHLFLISEAVRGEGGILKNHKGQPFMQGVHEMADLAPRDIVTRAILSELKRSGETNVFLDVSSMTEEFFSKRFPTIYGECKEFGINIPHDWIPVRPAQHYLMGGIKTDLYGMTNINGLYACGEAASTGIHGGNRLASNSVLECLVFSRRAAFHINDNLRSIPKNEIILPEIDASNNNKLNGEYIYSTKKRIRGIMTEYAGAVRTHVGLNKAIEIISGIRIYLEDIKFTMRIEYELYSMVQMAEKILTDAINRKESVGAHYFEE